MFETGAAAPGRAHAVYQAMAVESVSVRRVRGAARQPKATLDIVRHQGGIVSRKDCRRLRKAVSEGRHSKSVACPGCGGDGTVEVTNDGTKEKKTCQLCKGTGKA